MLGTFNMLLFKQVFYSITNIKQQHNIYNRYNISSGCVAFFEWETTLSLPSRGRDQGGRPGWGMNRGWEAEWSLPIRG